MIQGMKRGQPHGSSRDGGDSAGKSPALSPAEFAARVAATGSVPNISSRLYFGGLVKKPSPSEPTLVPPLNMGKLRAMGEASTAESQSGGFLAPRRPTGKKPIKPNVTRTVLSARRAESDGGASEASYSGSLSARFSGREAEPGASGSAGQLGGPVFAWANNKDALDAAFVAGDAVLGAHGARDASPVPRADEGRATSRMALLRRAQFSKTFIDVLEERNPSFSRAQLRVRAVILLAVHFSRDARCCDRGRAPRSCTWSRWTLSTTCASSVPAM